MRDFSEYKKDSNATKNMYGEIIFLKRLEGLEGEDIIINRSIDPIKGLIVNEDNINSEKYEFRTLSVKKDVNIKHGDEIIYEGEYYLVVTEIDNHYYYKSCKIRKCNQILKWKMNNEIHEYPCILNNDSYGVKVLSDNDYIRSQNIKAQITVQFNEYTKKLIPDMRYMFNHSEFDIYNCIDINKSMTGGLITLTAEKSVVQIEDNLKDNLAFSKVLVEGNIDVVTPPVYTYTINGVDSFNQETDATFSINPLLSCTFYIDDFDSSEIAYITFDDTNGTCTVHGKSNIADNWFTLYAKDSSGNIITSKKINVVKV